MKGQCVIDQGRWFSAMIFGIVLWTGKPLDHDTSGRGFCPVDAVVDESIQIEIARSGGATAIGAVATGVQLTLREIKSARVKRHLEWRRRHRTRWRHLQRHTMVRCHIESARRQRSAHSIVGGMEVPRLEQ